jgi:hypothetical protein
MEKSTFELASEDVTTNVNELNDVALDEVGGGIPVFIG